MEALVEVFLEKYSANYQYGFRAWLRADFRRARDAAFCALAGITP